MVFSWSYDAVFHRDNWWIQAVIRTQKISDIIEFLCLSDELIFTRHVDALLTPRRDPSIFKLPIYVIGFKIIKNTNMIVFRILCQLFSVVSAVPAGPCQNTGKFEENQVLRTQIRQGHVTRDDCLTASDTDADKLIFDPSCPSNEITKFLIFLSQEM